MTTVSQALIYPLWRKKKMLNETKIFALVELNNLE